MRTQINPTEPEFISATEIEHRHTSFHRQRNDRERERETKGKIHRKSNFHIIWMPEASINYGDPTLWRNISNGNSNKTTKIKRSHIEIEHRFGCINGCHFITTCCHIHIHSNFLFFFFRFVFHQPFSIKLTAATTVLTHLLIILYHSRKFTLNVGHCSHFLLTLLALSSSCFMIKLNECILIGSIYIILYLFPVPIQYLDRCGVFTLKYLYFGSKWSKEWKWENYPSKNEKLL